MYKRPTKRDIYRLQEKLAATKARADLLQLQVEESGADQQRLLRELARLRRMPDLGEP